MFFKLVAKIIAPILTAAIRVMDQCPRRLTGIDRHAQGIDDQMSAHQAVHGPTDYAAGEQVHCNGKIQPTLTRRDIGDITRPTLIKTIGGEILPERVLCGALALGHVVSSFDSAAWDIPSATIINLGQSAEQISACRII